MKTKILILLCGLFLASNITLNSVNTLIKVEAKTINYPKTNEEKIFNTCLHNGLDTLMARVIVAQAKHESGNFKSKLFKEHNNTFGFLHSKRRCSTTSVGPNGCAEGRRGYASYNNIEESTIDALIFLYNKNELKFKSVEEYSHWLKSINYYEANEELYTTALKRHLNKLKV